LLWRRRQAQPPSVILMYGSCTYYLMSWGCFLQSNPDSYFRQVIIALKRYETEYKPAQQADLVLHLN